jgi:7-cyano-7-deazaguanine reductase
VRYKGVEMDELKDKVKNLHFEYKKYPQKELLIAMPNPYPERDYEEEIVSTEFTSLCPLNPGQPDYAKITVTYTPDKHIVELKSLKFYLVSYRTVEIFFEEATNKILDDLVNVVKPRKMRVIAEWNVRGGIGTKVTAVYNK